MLTRTARILQMAKRNNIADTLDTSEEEVIPDTSESEYQPSEQHSESSSSDYNGSKISSRTAHSPEIPNIDTIVFEHSDVLAACSDSSKDTRNKSKIIKKRIRRKHCCNFCDQIIGNFFRHIERHHGDETVVQEILSLEKKSLKRKKLIDRLRREGDFCTSDIIPVLNVKGKDKTNYIACKFCHGYYSHNSLRRHAKKCFFNPDPTKRFNAQSEGQTIMSGHFGPHDILRSSGLLNMMRADEIALAAKKDYIICEVGRRYIRSHKEKHLLNVAKRNMRRLARLLVSTRNIAKNNSLKMIDILTPTKFKLLIAATHDIAEYDKQSRTFKSPSLALQMGTLIKLAIDTAYSLEIQKIGSNSKQLEDLKALTRLIESDWAYEVSSEASQNLAINKFNKPTFIPLAEDVVKFEKYLKELILKSKEKLIRESKDMKAFRQLQEAIFCCVLIFNKRRVGELQRMTLSTFTKSIHTAPSSSEFEKALTETEKILFRKLRRVVIRGKRGRGVPVLFEEKTVEAIEFAIMLRGNFDLSSNPYIFGIPGTDNPIAGYAVMQKHAKLALNDVKKASLLTSTKLRKQLATVVQIVNMSRSDLEQLATFMGHTEKTHEQFYRLPDDIYQTAKVSKLLLLAKHKSIEQFKGKSLKDIDINNDVPEAEDSDNDSIDQSNVDASEVSPTIIYNRDAGRETINNNLSVPVKKGPKRTLVMWTTEQKKYTEDCFQSHIRNRKVPKKGEVIALMEKYPKVFHNKPWATIKAYVYNKITKK